MIYYIKTIQSILPPESVCPINAPLPPLGTSSSDILALCYCQALSTNEILNKAGDICSTYLEILSFS